MGIAPIMVPAGAIQELRLGSAAIAATGKMMAQSRTTLSYCECLHASIFF
jgi:hypothetical protein